MRTLALLALLFLVACSSSGQVKAAQLVLVNGNSYSEPTLKWLDGNTLTVATSYGQFEFQVGTIATISMKTSGGWSNTGMLIGGVAGAAAGYLTGMIIDNGRANSIPSWETSSGPISLEAPLAIGGGVIGGVLGGLFGGSSTQQVIVFAGKSAAEKRMMLARLMDTE